MKHYEQNIYRSFNADLSHLTDQELCDHFIASQHEPRIYGPTRGDRDFLSMRWLRGSGMEIGAGMYPTPLFGNATVVYADCDEGLAYGGQTIDIGLSLDDLNFLHSLPNKYDFIVASHVLEHVDSFVRAIHNLVAAVNSGGMIYIVLPDKRFLNDKNFIRDYSFEHHKLEFTNPTIFNNVHDERYINYQSKTDDRIIHADITPEYKAELASGVISHKNRFLHHKHSYSFVDWINIIFDAKKYLKDSFELVDMRYGHERNDCHFVLRAF